MLTSLDNISDEILDTIKIKFEYDEYYRIVDQREATGSGDKKRGYFLFGSSASEMTQNILF